MGARVLIRPIIAILGLGLGSVAAAADDDDRSRLKTQGVVSQQSRNQKSDPPAQRPPIPAKSEPSLPEGAIARLGDSRLRHSAPVTCVTFSPDGKQIITGGQDQALRVWDASTGEAVRMAGTGFVPTAVSFSHRGSRLAITGPASQLRFLHPDSLKELSSLPTGGAAGDFAISPDGKRIATVSAPGRLVVTELDTGLPKLELTLDGNATHHFAFHPDGKSIGVAAQSGKVTFYLLAGGKPIRSFDHGGSINGFVIRSDGKRIATGGLSPSEVVKIWELGATPGEKNPRPVAEIAVASKPHRWLGSDRLAVGSSEGAGVYDLGTKKWVGRIKFASGEWDVSPDGSLIAATGENSLRVRVWDLHTGKERHADNDAFPNAALLTPTADGKSLFLIAGESAFRWPVDGVGAIPAGTLPAKAVVAAAGGKRLAVATPSSVLIYDDFNPTKALAVTPDRSLTELAASPRSLAISPDGSKVAYSGEAMRIIIADAGTGKTLRILPTQTHGLALAFSPDSKRLAVLGRDAVLRLWAAAALPKGAEDADLWKVRVQRGLRGAVAFSPDGQFVAASSSTMLVVVRADRGENAFQLERQKFDDGIFQQIAFTPDSKYLVTGSAGPTGAIHVFEVSSQKLLRRYTTGFGAINRLAVFPDSSRFATAGAEDVITLWDIRRPGGENLP